jgi:hypothetical protein
VPWTENDLLSIQSCPLPHSEYFLQPNMYHVHVICRRGTRQKEEGGIDVIAAERFNDLFAPHIHFHSFFHFQFGVWSKKTMFACS